MSCKNIDVCLARLCCGSMHSDLYVGGLLVSCRSLVVCTISCAAEIYRLIFLCVLGLLPCRNIDADEDDDDYEAYGEEEDVGQQGLQPSKEDPGLFIVQCRYDHAQVQAMRVKACMPSVPWC